MVNRNFIKCVIILLLIGLIGYVYTTSRNLSCDQCTVTFNEEGYKQTYNMSDLFNQTKLTRCPIYWDRVQGYVQG